MNFEQLKRLVRRLGGVLVLNGNEPEFVILSYDQYRREDNTAGNIEENPGGQEDEKTIEKLNQEILALKDEIRQRESAELIENVEEKEPIADVIDFE